MPARSLNLLAAAWIQFQVHDWVNHARHALGTRAGRRGAAARRHDGGTAPGAPGRTRCASPATRCARPAPAGYPVFRQTTSHWWDGSEVYGATPRRPRELRDGRKLRLRRTATCRGPRGHSRSPASTRAGGSASARCTRSSPASTTWCATSCSALPGMGRRARLPDRAAHRLGADRQDPHGGVDPGDPRHQDDRHRHEHQLERPAVKDWLTRLGIWLVDAHAAEASPRRCPTTTACPTR